MPRFIEHVAPAILPPFELGPMPVGRAMETVDEGTVRAPIDVMFQLVRDVEQWPAWLAHYRRVGFRSRTADGGGVVEMSANRPFGLLNWPTWWLSQMSVDERQGIVRFRHIGGITKGMDVEWRLEPRERGRGTHVRLLHVWDGPRWPLIGAFAATQVIGPVFIHGIASRTLAGLTREAETRAANRGQTPGSGRRGRVATIVANLESELDRGP